MYFVREMVATLICTTPDSEHGTVNLVTVLVQNGRGMGCVV
jgi:hypothetical protein